MAVRGNNLEQENQIFVVSSYKLLLCLRCKKSQLQIFSPLNLKLAALDLAVYDPYELRRLISRCRQYPPSVKLDLNNHEPVDLTLGTVEKHLILEMQCTRYVLNPEWKIVDSLFPDSPLMADVYV